MGEEAEQSEQSEQSEQAPEPLVDARRLLEVADGPPLAPEEPDGADRGRLLPLELLAWDGADRLVGVRCTGGAVVLRSGRPATRRTLDVQRLTRWARAGRVTLHGGAGPGGAGGPGDPGGAGGDVELRLLAPHEYAGRSLGDAREGRLPGPTRMARSAQLAEQRDEVASTLVQRVRRVHPEVQVGNG